MSETKSTASAPYRTAGTPPDDLDHMTPDQLLREAVREMRATSAAINAINARLDKGSDRMHQIEADLTICVRACQTLLLHQATDLQIVRSLDEVSSVRARLEREEAERVNQLGDEITRTDHAPVRSDTLPSPAPEGCEETPEG